MNQASIKHYQLEKEYYFHEGCYINELSNSAGDEQLSIARARVAPGTCTKWHKLSGISERYVIQSGIGEVEIGNLPPAKVGSGDVVSIPPDTRQRIRNIGQDELVFLAICTPRFIQQAYQLVERQA